MPSVKDLIGRIESGDISYEEKLAALAQVEASLQELKAKKDERVKFNVQLIIDEIKKVKQDVQVQLDYARSIVPERGPKGDAGDRGLDGAPGQDGRNGQDGRDGKDGADGQDGVSVTDAKIDFDGSLIITLSTGREINVGEVVAADLAEKIRVTMSTNSTVTVQDEGTVITSGVRSINFTGTGVTATASGDSVTVNVAGGSGGVTSVTGTSPIVSSGGATPAISLTTVPVSLGGTGTSTPSLVAGTNVTISGTWPNQTVAASGGSSTITISNKTSAYTVVAGDLATIINCTSGTFTVSLMAAATLGAGFNVTIWNTSTTLANVITIDPNGAETIDGVATLTLRRGEGMQIICNGTSWETGNKKVMRGYAENIGSTEIRPVVSGSNSIAIGLENTASGNFSLAIGYLASATNLNSYAIGPGTSATSFRAVAFGSNSGGGGSQAVTGTSAMALGGSYASGTDSFAAAVANNTSTYGAQGANSIAIGQTARATASRATAIGGLSPAATGSNSVAIGGDSVSASGAFSVILGGNTNLASGDYSYAFGSYASATEVGKIAWGAFSASLEGSSQAGMIVLRADTTNATATVLCSNTNAASAANQLTLRNRSAYAFTGTIIARQQAVGGSNYAAWEIKGAILRDATAASTTLGTFNINALSATAGAAAWVVALSANTTNGCLAITVTGAASTNIRWVATVQTSEVTYA